MRILTIIFCLISGVSMAESKTESKNVLGEKLKLNTTEPMTGFYRDGFCRTGAEDSGSHVVAAIVTQAFLDFTKSRGNDLQTPQRASGFPGLKPGDSWCLCANRWKEAHEAGAAPLVKLEATHEKALKFIPLETLKKYEKK
jgi:uncharacterized protein